MDANEVMHGRASNEQVARVVAYALEHCEDEAVLASAKAEEQSEDDVQLVADWVLVYALGEPEA